MPDEATRSAAAAAVNEADPLGGCCGCLAVVIIMAVVGPIIIALWRWALGV